MIQSFRQRLFKQFILLSVSLGIPLLICLVVLGSMVPRARIGTVSLATAAQIAEVLTTNLALRKITLNPNFSVEGHKLQTQPVFYPIASKTRDALVRRSGEDFVRQLLEEYIATEIQLVITPKSPEGSALSPQLGTIIAALNTEQLGQSFNYAVYEDEDISASLSEARTGNQGAGGDDKWSAFAPVFDKQEQTVAMVVVHSDATMISRLDLVGALAAFILVGSVIGLSIYFASRMAWRIHHPIKSLHDGMLELANGNLDVKLTSYNTGDEFDDLIRHFNHTSQQLKERMSMIHSMEMAAEIQAKLLPKEYPDIRQYDLAASLNYAELAGGDYYDFIYLKSEKSDSQKWILVVGDVTGHGVSAALLVAWLRATIRVLARECNEDLVRLVEKLNATMLQDMNTGKFVTLFFAIVDESSNKINWLSAGHDPVHLFRAGSEECELLKAGGPPVGVIASADWQSAEPLELNPQDTLLILTDGLQDAKNPKGKRLGIEAVDDCLRQNLSKTAKGIQQSLLELLDKHRMGTKLADDVTLLVVKRET
jgi:sigma-B regulation protein RsbU (phosphoserine phosphatase)